MNLKEQCKAQKLKRSIERNAQAKARKSWTEKICQQGKMIKAMRERLASEKKKRLAVLAAITGLLDGGHVSEQGQIILMEEIHRG